MLAIICAIRQEFDSLLKEVDAGKIALKNGFRICEARYGHENVLIVETGPGKKRAKRATESVLKENPISGIVSLGFAGALNEGLAVGDLVLCQTLFCQAGNSKEPCYCNSDWVSATLTRAKQKGIALQEGSSVSVRMPVCDIADKEALASEFPAAVVEMESYWIGQVAHSRGIPFICIRAISDALGDSLPPFGRLKNADGSWRKGEAVSYFLPKLWRLAKLAFLYNRMQKAAASLAKSLEVIRCFER